MKTVSNIDKALKGVKRLALISVICSAIIVLYNNYSSNKLIESMRNKVYVLKDGHALELAISRNANENKPAEVKSHIETFHKYFFKLDPDPVDINTSIKRGLYLIDESGVQLHAARQEQNYYHSIVEGSISTRVYIDSIKTNMSSVPYVCKIYAREKIIRKTKVVFKNLISQCQVRNVKRTTGNPHGLLIERFKIINNNTYDERAR